MTHCMRSLGWDSTVTQYRNDCHQFNNSTSIIILYNSYTLCCVVVVFCGDRWVLLPFPLFSPSIWYIKYFQINIFLLQEKLKLFSSPSFFFFFLFSSEWPIFNIQSFTHSRDVRRYCGVNSGDSCELLPCLATEYVHWSSAWELKDISTEGEDDINTKLALCIH